MIMGKVVRIGGRGTSRRVVEKQDDDWTGEAFRKKQAEKKAAAKDVYVTIARGTKKVKLSDLAETKGTSSGKGMWVRAGRGSSKRVFIKK